MKTIPLLSEKLAQFAVRTAYEDIPENVMRRTKYLFLDAIGVAFASMFCGSDSVTAPFDAEAFT